MKNEDLYVYKKSDFYEDYIDSQKEYYEREQVDMLLAQKDREIALLKERICNGDVSRATWIDDCIAKDKEIAEIKQKLESAQASMYCDVVDANMENRRLRRALWLARAERAKDRQQLFHFSLDFPKLCIDGFYDPYSGRRELSPKQWIKVFNKVEIKCLKKAEEYK